MSDIDFFLGRAIYNKVAGYQSLDPSANPLRDDAVFKGASLTKLITSIAALQCIERGLIGLDDAVSILPELNDKDILSWDPNSLNTPRYQKARTPITVRMLLTHTSGLGHHWREPILCRWREFRGLDPNNLSGTIQQVHGAPLIYEPGTNWRYGGSMDWLGLMVRRLNGNISLETYFDENIWKRVGLAAPFPVFDLNKHPEYKACLMEGAKRCLNGALERTVLRYAETSDDEFGGYGLALTAQDFLPVLADLISDSPKLLKPETIDEMFTPQLPPNSPLTNGMNEESSIWRGMAGPLSEDGINHGLGSAIAVKAVPELGQPANLLFWGGAANAAWFASREKGVAGLLVLQVLPLGDPICKEIINAWKKDFWEQGSWYEK
jgi:CubicO group peptidase (beta-lactamase class C family)